MAHVLKYEHSRVKEKIENKGKTDVVLCSMTTMGHNRESMTGYPWNF